MAYLILLVALSIGGLVDDARARKPTWWLALTGCSALASVSLVFAYWSTLPIPASPLLLGGLLVFALFFDGWSALSDLRANTPDPELSAGANAAATFLGTGFVAMVLLPAYVWGFLAMLRA